MSLLNKLLSSGAEIYYDPGFRNVFEDHLNFIINNGSYNIETIDANTAARYAGDWRGLMISMTVQPYLHWFNMRINGYNSTTEYNKNILEIKIIKDNAIEKLRQGYLTISKK